MASIRRERKHGPRRISHAGHQKAGNRCRSRYARNRAEDDALRRQLEARETATPTGLAQVDRIQEWVQRGWLRHDEADEALPA